MPRPPFEPKGLEKPALVYILGTDLDKVGVIDDYYTLIWAERYRQAGDFELELPISYIDFEPLIFGNFLVIPDSETVMIIEGKKLLIGTDKDSLLITGNSAESLLKRRYILESIILFGGAEEALYQVVQENLANPINSKRRIPLLETFAPMKGYDALYHKYHEDRESVYDICTEICFFSGLGFKVYQSIPSPTGFKLIFEVYEGVDRSSQQTENSQVIFSRAFDNLISGSFYIRKDDNVNLVDVSIDDVAVAPTGHSRMWYRIPTLEDPPDEPEGLDLYESAIAVEIDRDADPEDPMEDGEVLWAMNAEAMKIIWDRSEIGVVEGEFDINGRFKYGEDFFMGDIIQIDFKGVSPAARVIELVRSYSVEGVTTYMSVDFVDKENLVWP